MAVTGRRKILPKMTVTELNQKLSNIMRVIVHPKYRTIGLGQKLVKETFEKCGTPFVETTAVMARYNPFFEKAGITKVTEIKPPKEALVMRETLAKLGFNITLLTSAKYVLSQLQRLKESQISMLRQAFMTNSHPRFSKVFFHNEPSVHVALYRQKIQAANLERLTKLIQITAMLLQTKVYLFWKNPVRP